MNFGLLKKGVKCCFIFLASRNISLNKTTFRCHFSPQTAKIKIFDNTMLVLWKNSGKTVWKNRHSYIYMASNCVDWYNLYDGPFHKFNQNYKYAYPLRQQFYLQRFYMKLVCIYEKCHIYKVICWNIVYASKRLESTSMDLSKQIIK